ncbi:AfsR/SARP family transcriptional regulator [Micromonospora peucetia]|uniref:DNA-binding transcriptional activator of the SARP family n=1 Tax=Micromonospora peucetia TaxID=47871 RepID=A0A1C6UK79_9ACTN|nr:AfsR/SARP family transcriptional regulator [Micromonospora peucetia]WSA34223.1 winged helix-turn-helix domain-containing protein [Micromonospora peucetia]SCL54447.1 DNA-binding transcriptional activator of the SARP family [Micromonospora peucetia]
MGPVEFHDGVQWRGIGSAKQRALLAMLLLKADQVVSLEQLVAELWDDNPPASASGLVAGYAWRLRRALNDREGRVLTTRSPGYRLVVAAETIDIGECERLIRQAHTDLAAGLPHAAVEGFDAALALWRGAPLADVRPTPLVMAEVARLEETRIATVEARIGAELELGRHNMLLPELKVLVSQHPLRERLHAHLMTALYRDGQQAVALGAYRDLRRLLVDELGIEPSESLRDLEQRILRNDPSLRPDRPGARPPARVVTSSPPVSRFPADPVTLRGRHSELDRLLKGVRSGRLGVVQGLAGAGKTALAVRAAHELAAEYPGGLVFVPMGGGTPDGPAEAARAVRVLADALGLSSPRNEHPASGWSTLLTGRRVLVVLDDVATAAQVRVLGPMPAGGALIATSRSGMTTLDGATRVSVGSLDPDDALDMLRDHLGAERVDAEPEAARMLVERCDALPLALRIAAARLATRQNWSLAAFAARLADPAGRLDALVCESMTVRDCLAGAVRVLARYGDGDGVALRALCLLGRLDRGMVSVSNLAALSGQPTAAAEVAVERLVDTGLAEALPDGRYRIPELVRAHVRELGHNPECDQLVPLRGQPPAMTA